jgi:hypothetical protein
MPETPTQPIDRAAVLDALAAEIGTSGAANDTALRTMAKGFQDGLTEIASVVRDLAKGGKVPPPKAAAHPEPDGDEEPPEEDEEEAPPPGAPMGKGQEGQVEWVDGTKFLVDLRNENRELKKAVRGLGAKLDALIAAQATDRELQGRAVAATGSVLGELSKGLVGVQGMLRSTPAGSPMAAAAALATRDAVRAQLEAAAPAVRAIAPEKLSKALQLHIIEPDRFSFFKRTGTFDPDAKKHADYLARVLAA